MAEPVYEYKLVYFGSVDKFLAEGWEPNPGTSDVHRQLGSLVQTFVWMRRRK